MTVLAITANVIPINPGPLSCIQMTIPEIIAHEATVLFNTMTDLVMKAL